MTVTYHPSAVWATAEPVTGPPLPWATIDTDSVHYTAALNLIDGDLGEFVYNIPPYLRAIHRDYLNNRPQFNSAGVKTSSGYSIGYNFAVDWLGGVWELRGWDIRCAANAGHNDHTVAILCLVDGADALTDEALASIRWIVAETERRAKRQTAIKGHQQIGSTACPGAGIMTQIRAGKLSPRWIDPDAKPAPVEPEKPPTQTPIQEDDMAELIRVGDDAAIMLRDGLVVTAIREQVVVDSLIEDKIVPSATPRIVRRKSLKAFRLDGAAPSYDGYAGPLAGRTVPSDFRDG